METAFSSYFLPVTLAIITLGMGLSISYADFKNIFFRPKAVLVGIASQIILLPALAFLIAWLLPMNPMFKVGLIIIAACPGGATSNMITYLMKGNVALSISMTALNSIITLITIPLNVTIALSIFLNTHEEIHLNILNSIVNVFALTIIPAAVGVNIRQHWTAFANKLDRPLRYILPLILLVVYVGVVFVDEGAENVTRVDFIRLLPIALMLNASSMLLGYMTARTANLTVKNQFTIAIEVGLQNSALAIFVAGTLLGNLSIALVPVVYGSFTFFSTAFFAWLMKKYALKKGY